MAAASNTNNHQDSLRINDWIGFFGGVAASTITDARAAVTATSKNAVRQVPVASNINPATSGPVSWPPIWTGKVTPLMLPSELRP